VALPAAHPLATHEQSRVRPQSVTPYRLVCRNNNDMIRVLDAIRAIPGITQVDTYSVLRVEKENWRFTELARD